MDDIIITLVADTYKALDHDYFDLADYSFMDFDDLELPLDEQDDIAYDAINDALSEGDADNIFPLAWIFALNGAYETAYEITITFMKQLRDRDPEDLQMLLKEVCTNL